MYGQMADKQKGMQKEKNDMKHNVQHFTHSTAGSVQSFSQNEADCCWLSLGAWLDGISGIMAGIEISSRHNRHTHK